MAEIVRTKADEAKIIGIILQKQFRGASYWDGERSRQAVVESLAVDIGAEKGLSRLPVRLGIIEVKYTRADFDEGRHAAKHLGSESGAFLGFDEFGRFNGKMATIGNTKQKDMLQKARLIEVDLKRLLESNNEVRQRISDIVRRKDESFIKSEIKRISSREILKERDKKE